MHNGETPTSFTRDDFESACESAVALAHAARSYYNLIGQIGDEAEALDESTYGKSFGLLQYLLRGFLYQELFKLYDTSRYSGLKFSIPEILKMIESIDFGTLREDKALELLESIGIERHSAKRKLSACATDRQKQERIIGFLRHRFADEHKGTFEKIGQVRNQIIAHPTLNPNIEDFAQYGELGKFADWCITVIEGLMKAFYRGAFYLPDDFEAGQQKMAVKRLISLCVVQGVE